MSAICVSEARCRNPRPPLSFVPGPAILVLECRPQYCSTPFFLRGAMGGRGGNGRLEGGRCARGFNEMYRTQKKAAKGFDGFV